MEEIAVLGVAEVAVLVVLEGEGSVVRGIPGHIRAVTFTAGKVRYSVMVDIGGTSTTLHNLDSAIVEENPNGQKLKEMAFDNYS